MNKTRIRALAHILSTGALATHPDPEKRLGYNQRTFLSTMKNDYSGHNCGTVACIAGTTIALFGDRRLLNRCDSNEFKIARQLLGLTHSQANSLFTSIPAAYYESGHEPTAKDAALTLFKLADTGEVNWS